MKQMKWLYSWSIQPGTKTRIYNDPVVATWKLDRWWGNIRLILNRFDDVNFEWISRDQNMGAHGIGRLGLRSDVQGFCTLESYHSNSTFSCDFWSLTDIILSLNRLIRLKHPVKFLDIRFGWVLSRVWILLFLRKWKERVGWLVVIQPSTSFPKHRLTSRKKAWYSWYCSYSVI